MEITEALQQLAKFSDPILPVVSVYLNTHPADRHQRAEAAAFLAPHVQQARALELASEAARDSLAEDLTHIEQWGEHLLSATGQADAGSMALFTCSGADLWVEFPSPVPFENEWSIADRPALRQLARLDADYTNALVVLLDAHAARICEVVLGEVLAEVDVDAEATPPPSEWGQLRYRRRTGADLNRHYREIADYLTAAVSKRPTTSIILSGPEDEVTALRQALSSQVRRQIIDEVSIERRASRERILHTALEILKTHERQEDQESVELLLNSAGRSSLAVLGLRDTLIAVNAGLVYKLIMAHDFRRRGWRCRDCDNIDSAEQVPSQCTLCGGGVAEIEVGEAMVSEVLRTAGLVEPVEPDVRLARCDGIGALLRPK